MKNEHRANAAEPLVIVTSSYPAEDEAGDCAAGYFVHDFAQALNRRGRKVVVVTQRKREGSLSRSGFEVRAYPWSGGDRRAVELTLKRPQDIRHVWSLVTQGVAALRRTCAEVRPRRVLCMWAVPAGLMAMRALRSNGIPYDVWCLGSDIWLYGRRPSTAWLIRRVLAGADRLFADGYGLASDVERVSGRNCRFLPSARVLPAETPVSPRLAPGRPNLLFVGRWHPHKGVDLLPRAMRLLREAGANAHLHIFGGGPLEDKLKAEVAGQDVADCVTLNGYADLRTASAYLRACNLLIIPSRIESIPVVFSDAVHCGIPVVGTDVGDLGALIARYRLGAVAQPESPESLADAMRRMLAHDRSAYRAGMRLAREVFDIEKAAQQYLNDVAS